MEAGAELIARLRLICGERNVLTHPALLSVYRSDGLRRDGPLPAAAVLPGTTVEVANIVSACVGAGAAFVVRGAGTSRRGGALGPTGAVLIVLSRLRRILELTSTRLTVEAGAPLAALPPPASGRWLDTDERLGTVGGFLAETPGGADVAAIELVRPDGSRHQLGATGLGYDLAGAFPGSRGRVGIAVTITLRPLRLP